MLPIPFTILPGIIQLAKSPAAETRICAEDGDERNLHGIMASSRRWKREAWNSGQQSVSGVDKVRIYLVFGWERTKTKDPVFDFGRWTVGHLE